MTGYANDLDSQSLTQPIVQANIKYSVSNFKMVMPGLLYRGGTDNDSRRPLSQITLNKLCENNFKYAVYAYNTNWEYGSENVTSCKNNKIIYINRQWNQPKQVSDVLKKLYMLIQDGDGSMYIHCWYGVHASGYISAVALMQFCSLTPSQGLDYWNSNVPSKLRYSKVQNMILNFKPDSHLFLTDLQQKKYCPSKELLENVSDAKLPNMIMNFTPDSSLL